MTARIIFSSAAIMGAIAVFAQHAHTGHDHSTERSHLRYVQNNGQWPSQVLFRSGFEDATMFLQKDGVVWSRLEEGAGTVFHDASNDQDIDVMDLVFQAHAWKVRFVDANPAPVARGAEKAPFYHNYFQGSDQANWVGGVPVFAEVMYEELWPGVDLRWHGQSGQVKYDLLLSPGSDPAQVGFAYEGLEVPVELIDGELHVTTSVGEFKEMKPIAWYADNKRPLACEFTLMDGRIGFEFPDGVDMSRGVVIDPLLMGATYSGVVSNSIYGHCATYDDSGNIYSGGQAFGPGLPASLGAFQATFGGGFGTDINVNKFSPDATTQIWATYIGGSSDEKPHSLIANAAQELTVFGSCTGTGYPTTTGALYPTFQGGSSDIVITRLNVGGTALIGSTYMGGTAADGRQNFNTTINYGDTYRGEVMIDPSNNTFVASCTESSDFPVSAGAFQGVLGGMQDGVVFGLNPDCSALVWSTFVGGTSQDNALGLRFDMNGDVYAVGATLSSNFPNAGNGWQNAYQGGDKDGYIVKISNGGTTLGAATYFGTTGEDVANFIDLDSNGDIYIYGQSDGGVAISPPTTYGQAGGNIFVAKFDPTLANALITTSLGPAGGFGYSMAPVAFLVDICDHIYVSGYNPSSSWATTPNALYATGGGSDFYLAAYDVDLAGQLFGTYYGGSHVDGGTSRFDKNGIIYQGVCSGGNSMPTSGGAFAPTNNVGWDIGVFKIDFQVAGVNAAGAGTQNQGCAPITINFVNNSTGNQFLWDFGDGSPTDTAAVPSHSYTVPGTFTVSLIAMDSLSCNLADTITFPITIGQSQPITAAFSATPDPTCASFGVSTVNNSTGTPIAFEWDMGDGSPALTDTNVVYNYAAPGTYTISLITYDPTGCSQPDTVQQTVIIPPPITIDAGFISQQVPDCDDIIVSTTDTTLNGTPTYQWDMGDGSPIQTSQNVTYTYTNQGTYTITLVVVDSSTCNISDTATANITVAPPDSINAAFTIDQQFDCSQLIAVTNNLSTGDNLLYSWNMGDGTTLSDTNAVHTYTSPGTYTVSLTLSDALGCYPAQIVDTQITLDPLAPVIAGMSVSQVNNCNLLQVQGTNLSTGDSVSYTWTLGDGTVLNTTDITHQYGTAGAYTIQLLVTDLTGCNPSDSIATTVTMVDQIPVAINSAQVICPGETITLDGTWNGATSYTWNTGATTPTIDITQGGTYTVVVTDTLCNGSATIVVTEGQVHDLYYEIEACPKAVVSIASPLSNAQSYQWATGETSRSIEVVGPSTYYYNLIDVDGCPHSDSVTVFPIDSMAVMYSPNAFTPDGDGINDYFEIYGFGEIDVELTIWDRWGELLHSASSKGAVWDGRYNGQVVQNGVYVYRLSYDSFCEEGDRQEVFGHVTVIR